MPTYASPRRFGIELEFSGDLERVWVALNESGLEVSDSRHTHDTGRAVRAWTLKRDGSVRSGGELISPPLDFDNIFERGQVNVAVDALRRANAQTSEDAGIHVHIECLNHNGSDFTGKQLANVVRFVWQFEDAIFRIASSGWNRLRDAVWVYARPLPAGTADAMRKAQTMSEVQEVWQYGRTLRSIRRNGDRPSPITSYDPRYTSLNLGSYFYRRTVEFRHFNSSLNAERIQAYVALCQAIVEDARRGHRRDVKNAKPIGSMAAGLVDEDRLFLRLQQVVRTNGRDTEVLMNKWDWKNLRKLCWKGSVPQSIPPDRARQYRTQ